eukprot:CAMPEP_0182461566 /NCGR_PEP_ID=MMETSP1319-20130603/6110_1 /TAXON_ID=172717 /ORGANISM="Bolidomonas pacifica, Strain RCC208" /LENGTH=61 /DNA_ID=CAMNT_0024660873 /DNA_START=144 /DNA_END=326 /DNA_ORIENTATION=+
MAHSTVAPSHPLSLTLNLDFPRASSSYLASFWVRALLISPKRLQSKALSTLSHPGWGGRSP